LNVVYHGLKSGSFEIKGERHPSMAEKSGQSRKNNALAFLDTNSTLTENKPHEFKVPVDFSPEPVRIQTGWGYVVG